MEVNGLWDKYSEAEKGPETIEAKHNFGKSKKITN